MTERRNLCGETYRLQSNFASIPTLLKNLFCSSAYYPEKVGLTQPRKKNAKVENLKHCDNLNRAMRVGGQKQCANETQHGLKTKQKKTCHFSIILWLAGTRF